MLPQIPFIFIRHGQTDWNAAKRWQGRINIPLNEVGLQQARNAAHKLRGSGIQRLVTSPLVRAHRTAEIIAQELAIPMDIDQRLMERNYGAFEGQNWEEVRRRHSIPDGQPHEHILPPDAEQIETVRQRVIEAIAFWLLSYRNQPIGFVSHGGCFGAIRAKLCPDTTYSSAGHAEPYRFQPTETAWTCDTL